MCAVCGGRSSGWFCSAACAEQARADPDHPWQHHLRNARVPWVDGMEWVRPGTSIRGRYPCQPPVELAIPDAYDQATTYLLLAELARRVGLDPTWGVLWFRDEELGMWVLDLHTRMGGTSFSWDLPTTDPTLALCMALEATAPKEEVSHE